MEDQYYDIERRTAIKEEARMFRRKFITYEQAEIIYSISHRKLRDIAEKAGAVYRINDVSVLMIQVRLMSMQERQKKSGVTHHSTRSMRRRVQPVPRRTK